MYDSTVLMYVKNILALIYTQYGTPYRSNRNNII